MIFNARIRNRSGHRTFRDHRPWRVSGAPSFVHLVVTFFGIAGARVCVGEARLASDLRLGLAWQIGLERVGFSPGVIDGRAGRRTEIATREFQRVRGLPTTGRLDTATSTALGVDPSAAVATYVVHSRDLQEVGPVPTNWVEKSRQPRLGYESVAAAIAERFHCSLGLLGRLNPGVNLTAVQSGDVLNVPGVSTSAVIPRGEVVEINFGEKTVRILNRERQIVALLHCSIAKDKEKLPSGETRVAVIRENPSYTFDPKMWPEVKGIDRKLLIPPGPRNPVGRCWVGLGLPGYGIHGSPHPEMIGKTGSHGCFRLTNWDALRLGKMIRVGAKVRFVGHPGVVSRKASDRTPSAGAGPSPRGVQEMPGQVADAPGSVSRPPRSRFRLICGADLGGQHRVFDPANADQRPEVRRLG